jgi:flagellar biosynthetic protein FliQ
MTDTAVITIVTEAVILASRLVMPVLLATLVVGVVVSLLQTVTQIQEQTLTFVPKLVTVGAILVVGGNWMLTEATTYVVDLWQGIPELF